MTNIQYRKELGQLIKKYRVKRNMTHERLGELVQTDGNTISRYERGVQVPHSDALVRLQSVLRINIFDYPEFIESSFDPDKE